MGTATKKSGEGLELGLSWLRTTVAVAIFLALDALIWVYTRWDAEQPGADSIGPAIFLVPILGLLAALWGLIDGYHRGSWQGVALRWTVVTVVLSVADAVYDQGAWLRDPDSWFFVNLAWSAFIYGPLLVGGAGIGRTVGLDVREWRGRRRSTKSPLHPARDSV